MKRHAPLFGNGPRALSKDHPVSLRIGDQTNTMRLQPKITTERDAGTLLVGGLASVRFYDEFCSRFGGLYRVVEERPSCHGGKRRIFVLEKTDL